MGHLEDVLKKFEDAYARRMARLPPHMRRACARLSPEGQRRFLLLAEEEQEKRRLYERKKRK